MWREREREEEKGNHRIKEIQSARESKKGNLEGNQELKQEEHELIFGC